MMLPENCGGNPEGEFIFANNEERLFLLALYCFELIRKFTLILKWSIAFLYPPIINEVLQRV
jgi:hypothetical protein